VQTEVVHVVVSCARRTQGTIEWPVRMRSVVMPPGTMRMSGLGTSANACFAWSTIAPV
jgi:hypothetical protein